MATHYKSPSGWTAEVRHLKDVPEGMMFKFGAGKDEPVYVRGRTRKDGMCGYHARGDERDGDFFSPLVTVYCNWPRMLMNHKCVSKGAIDEFFATYQVWAEADDVVKLIDNELEKPENSGKDAEFDIVVYDKGWPVRVGVRFFVKDDVRIGVLFPYIGNVPVAAITGDDWETTIYHEELEE